MHAGAGSAVEHAAASAMEESATSTAMSALTHEAGARQATRKLRRHPSKATATRCDLLCKGCAASKYLCPSSLVHLTMHEEEEVNEDLKHPWAPTLQSVYDVRGMKLAGPCLSTPCKP